MSNLEALIVNPCVPGAIPVKAAPARQQDAAGVRMLARQPILTAALRTQRLHPSLLSRPVEDLPQVPRAYSGCDDQE